MAKRFTDTDKWNDDWFLSLSPKMKCAWSWITDNCNGAGIQKISFQKISNEIREEVTRADFDAYLSDRIFWIKDDIIWIHGFIKSQHPNGLSPKNRAHVNIAKLAIRELGSSSPRGRAEVALNALIDFIKSLGLLSSEVGPTSHEARTSLIRNNTKNKENKKEGSVRGDENSETSGLLSSEVGPTSHEARTSLIRNNTKNKENKKEGSVRGDENSETSGWSMLPKYLSEMGLWNSMAGKESMILRHYPDFDSFVSHVGEILMKTTKKKLNDDDTKSYLIGAIWDAIGHKTSRSESVA